MLFQVTARDPSGATRVLSREADSREALVAALRAERLLVLSVTEVRVERTLPPSWHPAWLKPFSGFAVEMGLRQLTSMLKSGITLLAALQTVADQAESPRGRRAWLGVRERVFGGMGFARSLEADARHFDSIVVQLAEVGERAGELERTVSRAADQLESRRNLRTQVVNALVYPCIAVVMAVAVSVFLVVSVIPKLAEFLKSSGTTLPALTQSLMDFADWVNANGLTLLGGLVAAVCVWLVLRVSDTGREAEDVFLLRLPIVGRILRLSGTALFARSMQILTESGVTLLDALATARLLMANSRLRRRVAEAREAVTVGKSLESALAPAVEFMPMLRRMAAVGEVSGSLPETFGETAAFHEMLLALAIKRFGMLIEPVMICVTGLIVGFVYIAFFLALFSIASGV